MRKQYENLIRTINGLYLFPSDLTENIIIKYIACIDYNIDLAKKIKTEFFTDPDLKENLFNGPDEKSDEKYDGKYGYGLYELLRLFLPALADNDLFDYQKATTLLKQMGSDTELSSNPILALTEILIQNLCTTNPEITDDKTPINLMQYIRDPYYMHKSHLPDKFEQIILNCYILIGLRLIRLDISTIMGGEIHIEQSDRNQFKLRTNNFNFYHDVDRSLCFFFNYSKRLDRTRICYNPRIYYNERQF